MIITIWSFATKIKWHYVTILHSEYCPLCTDDNSILLISEDGGFLVRIASPSRAPDWRNLAEVLERRVPARPTLFEFFLNERLYTALSGMPPQSEELGCWVRIVRAFENAGYDYAMLMSPWTFPLTHGKADKSTVSLNQGDAIGSRADFDRYPWPDYGARDFGFLDELLPLMPQGMKLIMCGPDGVLETAIALMGYERMCEMLYDDQGLVEDVFAKVGEAYLSFHRKAADHPAVMAVVSSDDWGFNTQTLISPAHLRKLVFPWHREVCALAHRLGKYAILHSCGALDGVWEDIVAMGFDGRHSYEDNILPVERAYELQHSRIAVLGGIDLGFLVRQSEEEIALRCRQLLRQTAAGGGYALGSGNSIPDYVPDGHYYAMLRACFAFDG